MIRMRGKVMKWGNSYGILLTKAGVKEAQIKENQEIEFFIPPKNNVLKETFGMLKGKMKKPTQEIMDEIRRELYDD